MLIWSLILTFKLFLSLPDQHLIRAASSKIMKLSKTLVKICSKAKNLNIKNAKYLEGCLKSNPLYHLHIVSVSLMANKEFIINQIYNISLKSFTILGHAEYIWTHQIQIGSTCHFMLIYINKTPFKLFVTFNNILWIKKNVTENAIHFNE